jgi:uncharacterized membrane protein YphA (DoxX/SURF4 family)
MIEIIGGLLLLINFRPAFGALILAPICISILIWHSFLESPSTLLINIFPGVIVSILDIYLGYAYWDKYKRIFEK